MAPVIIGIGASAGGLEAVSELLSSLPAKPGAAVLVVQHMHRTHESMLSAILARRTSLPVLAAENGIEARADHIYVIPPNATLTVSRGKLVLAERAPDPEIHKPVDALFRSLAEECGDSAVGVVLSGGDSDGSDGIQAIKQAGGITFAQAPETASVPSMPLSAIDTGCVDFVMPPNEIARELVRLASHPYMQPMAGDLDEEAVADDSEILRRVFRRIRAKHGVDFARYKMSTLRRRLARRMALQKIDRITDYTEFLESDAPETAALYQDFLIRVTSFFRDPESFRVLSAQVFPQILASHSNKAPVRIWVPGCATGEEVYSIAITLIESIGQAAPPTDIQIFGTDVSESCIETCRAGLYSDSIAAEVSADRLRRFFVKKGSQYAIARAVRDLCVFARHDITRDPPYSKLDLVSCRNLLIYLGAASQGRVMQVFRYALRPSGFLLLGPAEGVGQGEELFEAVDKQHRLFRPRPGHGSNAITLPPDGETRRGAGTPASAVALEVPEFIESDAVQRQADRMLLARYSPAAILVDDSLNILQFRGQTSPFLAPVSGTPSLNLMRIARPELMLAVPAMIQESRQTGRPVQRLALNIDGAGPVNVEVAPLAKTGHGQCFLILLESVDSQPTRRDRRPPAEPLSEQARDQRLAQMERENYELREFLQATLEQHEAAKEELRSAHEEVLSANEEFQSTNEELETSKEELQSANEELTTTNDELRERNRQLAVLNSELEKERNTSERARAYADGIVETVREPLVVLDGTLKVLRVNRAFCDEFAVLPERIEGHSLEVVSRALWDDALNEKLTAILSAGPVLVDFEVVYQHPRFGTRLLSLNGRKIAGDSDRSELILLAIEDVTDSRRKSDALREGSRRKDEFLAMLGHELRNPLAAITHATSVLKIGGAEQVTRMNELIERQTGRLVRLVNDMLDATRVSRGLIELQRKPVDLTRVVRDAAESARGRLEQQRHVLTVSVPDFPVGVEGDAVRLEQVVANLLENAIKYTEHGGRIDVELTEDGKDAVLRVTDNGIGIASADLSQVFDVFKRLDNPQAKLRGGLGLGLTIVRRVLELHGGRIEVRSAGLGRGSEFIARLPLKPWSPDEPRLMEHSLPNALTGEKRRRVLIVDDNVDAAAVMALELQHWGHEVEVANTGERGLRLLASFQPDVAFVNIGLPDIEGHEVVRRARATASRKPLRMIALTGYGTPDDRRRALDAGFDEHVVKPIDAETLGRLLRDG